MNDAGAIERDDTLLDILADDQGIAESVLLEMIIK